MTEVPTTPGCPPWCGSRHGTVGGEEDLLHLGGALRVRGTLLRLCASTDPGTGEVDGPYVLVRQGGDPADAAEYTLHEADALIDALTELVDQGLARLPGTPAPAVDRDVTPRGAS